MATIRDVAKVAGVSTATVSAVVNDTAYVSPSLRARVLAAIVDLDYAPMSAARNLKRGRSQLIALAVSDLSNPFFARIVCAAEAAVAGPDPALRVTLLRAFGELSPQDRAVLVLRYWEDRSAEETAAVLRLSPGAVRSRSSRALTRLRVVLGEDLDELVHP